MCRNIKKYSVLSASICNKKIFIPDAVNVVVQNCHISVTGILGTLVYKLHETITMHIDSIEGILLHAKDQSSINKALIGTTQALIRGMIIGVTTGFSKKLQLVGIGYRVSIVDNIVTLVVGLSHSIYYKLPVEVKATCLNQTEIILTSINKQLIGQVAADLRSLRPPEPFKGKGIRYMNEIVRNKDTKKR